MPHSSLMFFRKISHNDWVLSEDHDGGQARAEILESRAINPWCVLICARLADFLYSQVLYPTNKLSNGNICTYSIATDVQISILCPSVSRLDTSMLYNDPLMYYMAHTMVLINLFSSIYSGLQVVSTRGNFDLKWSIPIRIKKKLKKLKNRNNLLSFPPIQ